MKLVLKRLEVQTTKDTEFIDITPLFKEVVSQVGVTNGTAYVMTLHTTTAITVNEGLPGIEEDLQNMLLKLVPSDQHYRHGRFLHSDGQMAVNAVCHLRSILLGYQAFFPIADGQLVMGERQTIYFVELDGPLLRNLIIQVIGE